MRFAPDDPAWSGCPEKPCPLFPFGVFVKAPLDIGGDAGVELTVIGLDDVDVPAMFVCVVVCHQFSSMQIQKFQTAADGVAPPPFFFDRRSDHRR